MSRHSFPAQDPRCTVVVGWDNPLQTFFAQVIQPSLDDDAVLLWVGTAPQAIPTVAALQAQLAGWATLPPALAAQLTREQHAAPPPTPLQRWMQQFLNGA